MSSALGGTSIGGGTPLVDMPKPKPTTASILDLYGPPVNNNPQQNFGGGGYIINIIIILYFI